MRSHNVVVKVDIFPGATKAQIRTSLVVKGEVIRNEFIEITGTNLELSQMHIGETASEDET